MRVFSKLKKAHAFTINTLMHIIFNTRQLHPIDDKCREGLRVWFEFSDMMPGYAKREISL